MEKFATPNVDDRLHIVIDTVSIIGAFSYLIKSVFGIRLLRLLFNIGWVVKSWLKNFLKRDL